MHPVRIAHFDRASRKLREPLGSYRAPVIPMKPELCDDPDLFAMVQYHDEPFALRRQAESKGQYNDEQFLALLHKIKDWILFLAFHIIEGCTAGKIQEPLTLLFKEVGGKVQATWSAADILPERAWLSPHTSRPVAIAFRIQGCA
jgi:hypothetical protein